MRNVIRDPHGLLAHSSLPGRKDGGGAISMRRAAGRDDGVLGCCCSSGLPPNSCDCALGTGAGRAGALTTNDGGVDVLTTCWGTGKEGGVINMIVSISVCWLPATTSRLFRLPLPLAWLSCASTGGTHFSPAALPG